MRLVAADDEMRVIGKHTSAKNRVELHHAPHDAPKPGGGERVRDNARRLLFEFNKLTSTMLTDCAGLCFGSNSADSPEKLRALGEALGDLVDCPVLFINSARMVVSAHTRGGAGVALYAGNTVSACAVSEAGESFNCGSYGARLSDAGAVGIALAAVKAALYSADGAAPPTPLTGTIREYFRLPALRDIIDKIHNNQTDDDALAGVSLLVKRAADEGDETSLEIERAAARSLAKTAAAVTRLAGLSAPSVVVSGGVFLTNERLTGVFAEELSALLPGASAAPLKEKPAMGALYLAIKAGADYAAARKEKKRK
jgi:N-acetylglucosamine kinase-like BadF-type ATPase